MNVQPFANLKQGKESLMKALQDNLQERGVISNLEAILRAEMFAALEQKYDSLPMPDSDTRLINELVREYLMFNGYGHSLSVFEAEANLSKTPQERCDIAQELNFDERLLPKIPLLYGIALRNKIRSNPTATHIGSPPKIPEWKVLSKNPVTFNPPVFQEDEEIQIPNVL